MVNARISSLGLSECVEVSSVVPSSNETDHFPVPMPTTSPAVLSAFVHTVGSVSDFVTAYQSWVPSSLPRISPLRLKAELMSSSASWLFT